MYKRRAAADFVVPGYSVEWHVAEGDEFEPIRHLATMRGKARYLLLGERVALNLLARCSGIATACVRTASLLWSTTHQIMTAPSASRIWRRATDSAG
jgi:nicotinate-nucleotide pyrophosphorylase